MSVYLEHRVCEKVNELESKLPWFWFLWNRRFYMQQVCIEICKDEIELTKES